MTKAELITELVNLDCPDDTPITVLSKDGEYDYNIGTVATYQSDNKGTTLSYITIEPGD